LGDFGISWRNDAGESDSIHPELHKVAVASAGDLTIEWRRLGGLNMVHGYPIWPNLS